jgi:hypothetical protein
LPRGEIGAGAIPAVPASELERLLAAFEQYLRRERALAAGTAGAFVARARRLPGVLGGSLDGLTVGDVTGRTSDTDTPADLA